MTQALHTPEPTETTVANERATRTHESATLNTPEMRRILGSSFLGSAIEYYDFILYATAAALVFNKVFFVGLTPELAAFASFGTLAAGYLARPLGAAVFGHFGDRVGRKGALVASTLGMGVATVAIGLLPTSNQIGPAAAILLVMLRVLQGIAVGGEWGGAMLIALEHAPRKKRGFAASFANLGAPAGAILATLAVSAFTLLPDEQFYSWGWRIPFLMSIALVAVGLVVRLKVSESPVFQSLEQEAESRRIPLVAVFARHKKSLFFGAGVGISMFSISGMATIWAVNYAVQNGADKTAVLNAKALAAVAMFVMTIISARMCDRFGRRTVIGIGIVGAMLFAFPMLQLVQSGSATNYAIAVIVAQALQGIILGPLASFVAELFPTKVRFTGASLAYQLAAVIGAGFTPGIAAGLVLAAGGATNLLGIAWVATLAGCLVLVLLTKDLRHRELTDIT